jgi:hypothetical protein
MTKRREYPDDWEKTRGHGDHLTEAELAWVAKCYREGLSARATARQLKCSRKAVAAHFRRLRGGPIRRARLLPPEPPPPKIDRESRFYHSNFEPS